MALPNEDEIRAFAEKVGQVDANGKYTAPRSKLAAGAQKYRAELERESETEQVETTAQKLVRFLAEVKDELKANGREGIDTEEFITAVAPALIRREGLHLKGTRTHE